MLPVVRISEQLGKINNYWQPQIVGAINDFHVKLVRLQGPFMWHHHEVEDELFLVINGTLQMHHRDADGGEHVAEIKPGEFVIVPHGMEHMPVAAEGDVELMLLEPKTTLNTGTVVNERTYVPELAQP